MTVTYDPKDAVYLDEADARAERDRVFDLCHGCRLCFSLCPSFKSLFDLIDEHHDGDPVALTDAEHDRVVDECYQCKLCYLKCPYVPPHEWELDFPRLMLRSLAAHNQHDGKGRRGARVLAATDRMGRLATTFAPLANAATRSRLARTLMEKTVGIARDRALPPYASQRFSRWFEKHRRATGGRVESPTEVALFQTCLVEYQDPAIGRAFTLVCEHNEVGVELADGVACCGMPSLDAGDVGRFIEQAERNVASLAPHVEAGRTVVVPQPTCGYALKKEYPQYLGTDAARAVAAAVRDPSEYLIALHRQGRLSTDFPGETYARITWHQPCHLRAQQIGPKGKDLMALTGAEVTVVEKCAGIDGTWGYRKENYALAREVAIPLIRKVEEADAPCVAGDCRLACGVIEEETGRAAIHPLQVLARAYGLRDDR